MSNWMNFNDAEEQIDRGGVIPHGTLAKVLLKIRPGGAEPEGLATVSKSGTGSVFLDCEYTVLAGPHAKRKVYSLIGLHSPKGPDWGNQGRSLIRGILESARNIRPDDTSERAISARTIKSLNDLNGLEFVAKIIVEKGTGDYSDKNKIEYAVPPTHKDYAAIMAGQNVASEALAEAPQAAAKPAAALPAWAQ